jgi:hypothetical protein
MSSSESDSDASSQDDGVPCGLLLVAGKPVLHEMYECPVTGLNWRWDFVKNRREIRVYDYVHGEVLRISSAPDHFRVREHELECGCEGGHGDVVWTLNARTNRVYVNSKDEENPVAFVSTEVIDWLRPRFEVLANYYLAQRGH